MSKAIYKKLKENRSKYEEEIHCPDILIIMMKIGRPSHFCVKHNISEKTFYKWTRKHELFDECYSLGKMYAREAWENQGADIADMTFPPGVISHKFEHWKMIGWSRFGVSKNGRIKLDLDPKGTPSEHYSQLLQQASNGDFTSSEIKQLMEAVNVGMSSYKVLELQKEIDQLKSDFAIMVTNANGNHSITDKRIT